MPLAADDPRHVRLAVLVERAARRYGGSLLISETAAAGDARAPWIEELSATTIELLERGIDFAGVCFYPVLGMPEWHDPSRWTQMGFWDVLPSANFERVPPSWPIFVPDGAGHSQRAHRRRQRSSGLVRNCRAGATRNAVRDALSVVLAQRRRRTRRKTCFAGPRSRARFAHRSEEVEHADRSEK